MSIDFQPLQSQTSNQSSSPIDFQPIQAPQATQPTVPTQPPAPSTGIMGKIDAAALGFGHGVVDAVGMMGNLAKNIIQKRPYMAGLAFGLPGGLPLPENVIQSGTNAVSDIYSPVVTRARQFFTPQTPFEQQAVQENVPLYAGAATAGNVGTQIAIPGAVSQPMTAGTGAILKAIPGVPHGPIIQGALNQGIQGAVLGAANDPNNPMQGAITGATLGAVFGGAGGLIDSKLQRAGDVQNFETQNAIQAGIDPQSYLGQNRMKQALKSNGADYAKYEIGANSTQQVKQLINQIAPPIPEGQMPAEVLTNMAAENYANVRSTLNTGLKPLTESTALNVPSKYMIAIDSVNKKVNDLLPDALPNRVTFNQLWDYRKELDNTIRTVSREAQENGAAVKQLSALSNVRAAVTTDMLNSADSMGLKDQFQNLNQLYQDRMLPYQAFKTDIHGETLSDKAMNDIMTKFNKFSTAKVSMNLNDLNQITKTLGPEGKTTMGWALVQKAMLDAQDPKGITNVQTMYTRMKKYQNMGVFNKLNSPELNTVVNGIKRIADGSQEMMKQGTPIDAINTFWQKVPTLIGSAPGRYLLQMIGSSDQTKSDIRRIIGQLVSGSLVIHKVHTQANLPPQSQ